MICPGVEKEPNKLQPTELACKVAPRSSSKVWDWREFATDFLPGPGDFPHLAVHFGGELRACCPGEHSGYCSFSGFLLGREFVELWPHDVFKAVWADAVTELRL